MSGHSKWSKIKRAKASNDARRGALFTKVGKQLAIAARSGTDPDNNPSLAMVMATAKSINMPSATIERAIKRAADRTATALEEVLYDGYGQAGVCFLVEAATDNRKRTYPEIKSVFSKNGGRIGDPGSASWLFEHQGQILINGVGDDVLLAAIEAGGIDVIESDGQTIVTTAAAELHQVRDRLDQSGREIDQFGLVYTPKQFKQVTAAEASKINRLIESLDDHADVVSVYTDLDPDLLD